MVSYNLGHDWRSKNMIRAAIAIAAIILSVAVGLAGAGLLRRKLESHKRPESLRQVAPAAASFVLWSCVAFGLLIAVALAERAEGKARDVHILAG